MKASYLFIVIAVVVIISFNIVAAAWKKNKKTLLHNLSKDVAHLKQKTEHLEMKVGNLLGNNTRLYRIFAFFNSSGRRYCEIYTMSEAEEICKLAFNLEIPNPYFVHIPCSSGQEDCPVTFWRIKQSCFRPNNGDQPIFDCFVDPVDETCTRPVFLSCEGYTTNFAENWEINLSEDGSDVVNHEEE